uniref:G-protein coupled receptors family 1 profile domain-containing protein n=1 Tax=Eptatretus burgeri TaxID=7764 RepID=A0A8C4N3S4_EPTBU
MEMNQSLKDVFFLQVIFNEPAQVRPWTFSAFFFTYIVTVTLNLVLILLIILRKQLQKPVYIFLAYLLLMDIICSTTVLPRLMYSIIINNQTRINLCFIQSFFISFYAGMETYILGIMAIDRYLAVCHPLRYSVLMTNSKAHIVIWATLCWCFLTAGVLYLLLFRLTFCKDALPNVGCVFIAIANLSCEDITVNSIYGIALSSIMLIYIITVVIITYGFILYTCLRSVQDSEGRSKALDTCLTHWLVLFLFLFSFLFNIISLRLSAGKSSSDVFKHLSDSLFYLLQPLAIPIQSLKTWKYRSRTT